MEQEVEQEVVQELRTPVTERHPAGISAVPVRQDQIQISAGYPQLNARIALNYDCEK